MATALFAMTTSPGDGWIGRWSPGIGDPTLAGWLTVALYVAAAWSAQRTARVGRAFPISVRERWFWLLLAMLLGALAVNKQLDLQTALTELGRSIARDQGWYEERRAVQVLLVGVVGVGAVAVMAALLRLLGSVPMPTRVSLVGLGILGLFVVVRAASFHHVDALIRTEWLRVRANWILEMGGILTIMLGAQWRRVPRRDIQRTARPG